MNSTNNPNIKWAERKDKLFVTIELNEVKDPKIDLTDDNRLTFSGETGGKVYALDIPLFGEVNKAESKWTLDTRNIFINIKKKTKGAYWNYINKDKKKYNYIHVDWNMYVEEDEEDGQKDSFPGFGGGNNFMEQMGGMGGMGDFGGMNMGADDMDEDDVPKGDKDLDDLDKPQDV